MGYILEVIERNLRDSERGALESPALPHGELIPYPNRSGAAISVVRLEEPYGPGSEAVVSVGATLKGEGRAPHWKVHVPLSLAGQVAAAIMRAADPERGEGNVDDGRSLPPW